MLRSAHLVYLGDGNQTNLILIPHLYKDDTIKKCGVDMVKKEDKSKIKRKCRCIEATKRICSICDSLSLLNQMNQTNIQAMIIRSIQIEMFRSIPGKSNRYFNFTFITIKSENQCVLSCIFNLIPMGFEVFCTVFETLQWNKCGNRDKVKVNLKSTYHGFLFLVCLSLREIFCTDLWTTSNGAA